MRTNQSYFNRVVMISSFVVRVFVTLLMLGGQVRATDPDIDRNSHIRYSLMGQFADDGTFVINEHTGEIFATKALDRDPPGGRDSRGR